MKVIIKDFQVAMELGNKAIELEIKDNDAKHLGDLRISKAKIEWCKGRTHAGNGKQVSWVKFIKWLEDQE